MSRTVEAFSRTVGVAIFISDREYSFGQPFVDDSACVGTFTMGHIAWPSLVDEGLPRSTYLEPKRILIGHKKCLEL